MQKFNNTKASNFPKEETLKLFEEYRKTHDKNIKNKLIEANMGIVPFTINTFFNVNKDEYYELLSVGYEKLFDIIENYNPNEGSFSAYAMTCLRFVMNSRLSEMHINDFVSANVLNELKKVKKVIKEHKKKYGVNPSSKTISQHTGFSLKKVNSLLILAKGIRNIDEVELVDDNSFLDLYNDSNRALLDKCMDTVLNEREKRVIIERFGLNGEESKTLSEIGEEFNFTLERIRQIESRALKKMRRFFIINNKSYDDLKNINEQSGIENIPYFDKTPVDGYNEIISDYDGYTEDEFEDRGLGFK